MADAPQETAEQPTGTCLTCGVRDAEEGQLVCGPCATRIRFRLRDLGDLHHQLGDPVEVDDDWNGSTVTDYNGRPIKDKDGHTLHHHDPGLPAGPIRGRSVQPHVSGSPEPAVPVDLQAVDLDGHVVRLGGIPVPDWRAVDLRSLIPLMRVVTSPVRIWVEGEMHVVPITRKEAVRYNGRRILVPAVDEIGQQPIAVRLDRHMRRWVEQRNLREHRPVPTVPNLLGWLDARLDWAIRHDGRLWELDEDVRHMIAQVRGVLGLHDPLPQLIEGVACKRCDNRNTLHRIVGDPYINCLHPGCHKLYTEDELTEWIGMIAAQETARLGKKGVKDALRPKKLRPAEGTV